MASRLHPRRTQGAVPERSALPRAQYPAADFDPSKLHDDALIGASKAARFLGLADSSFYLLRRKMGREFVQPTMIVGRPRYRVGALRSWLRKMESANTEAVQ